MQLMRKTADYLGNISLHACSINPYRGDFINPWPTSKDWTQFPAIEAAHSQSAVAWIIHAIQIRMHIFQLEGKIILSKIIQIRKQRPFFDTRSYGDDKEYLE